MRPWNPNYNQYSLPPTSTIRAHNSKDNTTRAFFDLAIYNRHPTQQSIWSKGGFAHQPKCSKLFHVPRFVGCCYLNTSRFRPIIAIEHLRIEEQTATLPAPLSLKKRTRCQKKRKEQYYDSGQKKISMFVIFLIWRSQQIQNKTLIYNSLLLRWPNSLLYRWWHFKWQ